MNTDMRMRTRTMTNTKCGVIAPPSTPFPEDTSEYYGWFSEAHQQLRVSNPSNHKFNEKLMNSPPYCYWTQGDRKVLVTEVTHTSIPTPRQVANGDIYLGKVDKYWGRSYTRIAENALHLKTNSSADHTADIRTTARPATAELTFSPNTSVWTTDSHTTGSTPSTILGVE